MHIKHVVHCLAESRCSTNITKFIVIYLVRNKEKETAEKNEQK